MTKRFSCLLATCDILFYNLLFSAQSASAFFVHKQVLTSGRWSWIIKPKADLSYCSSVRLFGGMDQRWTARTVRSSLERDTLLSSLSLELWQKEESCEQMLHKPFSPPHQLECYNQFDTQLLTLSDMTLYLSSQPFLCESRTRMKHTDTNSVCAMCAAVWAFTYISVFVLMLLLFLWLLMWGGALESEEKQSRKV